MRNSRFRKVMLACALGIGAVNLGVALEPGIEAPDSGPAGAPAAAPGAATRPGRRLAEERPNAMVFPPRAEAVSEAERDETLKFARESMPNTIAIWDETSARPNMFRRQRAWLLPIAVFQHRRYVKGRQDFPEMEAQYLKDVKTTDDVVGLIRSLAGTSEGDKTVVVGKMREKLRDLAISIVTERHKRLERLRETLEREEKLLNRDEKRLDTGVDEGLTRLINNISFGRLGPTTGPGGVGASGAAAPSTGQGEHASEGGQGGQGDGDRARP